MKPHFADWDVRLYLGHALDVLAELEEGSCDSIVTSPPYLNARPEYPSPSEDEFSAIFRELRRVCTGPMLLNVGRLWRERREQLWWLELIRRAERTGWPHRDTVVWVKQNANPFQGEVVTNSHEYLLLFGDGFDEDAVRTEYDEESLARMKRKFVAHAGVKGDVNVIDPSEMEEREINEKGARGKSFFICPTGKEKGNKHPAPMPLELAEYMVRLSGPRRVEYCPKCDPGGVNAPNPTTARPVRGVRRDVPEDPPEEGTEVLLSEVRGQSSLEDIRASSEDDEGLRLDLQAGSSESVQGRIRDGAPPGDGGISGEDPRKRRDRPSPQRDQGRQSDRELGSHAEAAARSEAEAASSTKAVSELWSPSRSSGQARGECEQCGTPLAERPSVVLDPFAGSGTTLLAARRLGRTAVGIELSTEYAEMCATRLSQQTLPIEEGVDE